MNLLTDKLIPFVGTEHFKLYDSLSSLKTVLKENSVDYSIEIWDNKECTVPIPWTIIHIGKAISLFFANDKLFKIVVFKQYFGSLENGIKTGMPISSALEIDSNLSYDDWNEDYESSGYWVEEDESNLVSSISIFIPEVLKDEIFDKYEW